MDYLVFVYVVLLFLNHLPLHLLYFFLLVLFSLVVVVHKLLIVANEFNSNNLQQLVMFVVFDDFGDTVVRAKKESAW